MTETIDIKILDRLYTIACTKNEEDKVRKLSLFLEKKAKIINEKFGVISERNLLFMIALMIADEAVKVYNKNSDFEKIISELEEKIKLLEQEHNKHNQDITIKSSETVYMLEKILNRIKQVNISIKDEIDKLSNDINF